MRHFLLIFTAVLVTVIFSSCNTTPTYSVGNAGELEGTWRGYEVSAPSDEVQLVINGSYFSYTYKGAAYYSGTFTLDTSVTPRCMDAYISSSNNTRYAGKKSLSIYQLSADTLLIAGTEPGDTVRPSLFEYAIANTVIFRLVRTQRSHARLGDTVMATVDGLTDQVARLDLSPSDTVWVGFQAVEGTIYRFTTTGSYRLTARLFVDSTARLGTYVYISSSTRWTGQETKKYYIKVATDPSYVDTGYVTLKVHAAPVQVSGDAGSYLCWNNYHLSRLDASSGAVKAIGKSTDFFPVLQYGPNGILYGVCTDLCIIDPLNDKISVVGNFTYGSRQYLLMGNGAMSSNGVLYVRLLSSDSIFTVDLSTAKLTLVATCSEYGDFAMNGQDNMYVASSALSKINLPGFSVTTIGTISRYMNYITFTRTGQLMGISYDSLYTIDVTSARATSRLLLGDSNIDCFVEERPAAYMLAKRQGGVSPHRTPEQLEAMRQRYLDAVAKEQPIR